MKKKIFSLFLFFVINSFFCFAGECNISEVINWKYPGAVFVVETKDDGFNVVSWESEFPVPSGDQLKQDKDDYLVSQEYFINKFDPEQAIAREAQVFDASSLIRLMPYSYTLNELIRFKNFCGGVVNGAPYAGLKQVGQALVAGGQILQSDYDTLSGVLLEQGVSLDSCE